MVNSIKRVRMCSNGRKTRNFCRSSHDGKCREDAKPLFFKERTKEDLPSRKHDLWGGKAGEMQSQCGHTTPRLCSCSRIVLFKLDRQLEHSTFVRAPCITDKTQLMAE